MKKSISPSTVKGKIDAPASKSMAQRALAAALLSSGTSILSNLSDSNDVLAATEVVRSLGAQVQFIDGSLIVTGNPNLTNAKLNCGEAGLCVRMFSPIAALAGGEMILTGEGSLLTRPITMVEEPLRQLGVAVESNDGFLPLQLKGKLKGGKAYVDGSTSSQFLTGLLMALPLCENDSELIVNQLKSKPYIDMTLEVLQDFGVIVENHNYERFIIPGNQKYIAREYAVEGDWSGASCMLVAGAIAGEIEIGGLKSKSAQADRAMLKAIKDAGANIEYLDSGIRIRKKELQAFQFDATDCPDLFPALVTLATMCTGTTKLYGAKRLTHKESDRAVTLQKEFGKMGINIHLNDDLMEVEGNTPKGTCVHSHNDHRIAMACATVALQAINTMQIENAEAVNKSYPNFFEDIQQIILK